MMPARFLPLLVLVVSACGLASALAQEAPAWIGALECRLAPVTPAPAQAPSWNGGCKSGFADGEGTLEWRDTAGKRYRLEAVFAAGQVTGEGTLHYPDGTLYIGTFSNGIPNGHGYFKDPDGTQYVGDVRMGERTGTGEALYAYGDDYKGEFKNGRRDGTGVLVWKLGGRYEGGWENDRPHGPGKIVYAGNPAREGILQDGYVPQRAQDPKLKKTYEIWANTGATSTRDRYAIASNPLPPDRGFKDLTPEQQQFVGSQYAALAPGDEPPYPAKGPAEFFKALAGLTSKTGAHGDVLVYVLVGKDGKARSVTATGLDDTDDRKFVATAAGLVDYKPAVCAGQPCEMIYRWYVRMRVGH